MANTRGSSVIWFFCGVTATLCALVAIFILVVITPGRSRDNARCPIPGCGHEFNIPVHHGIARLTRQYQCPECGYWSTAQHLYIETEPVTKEEADEYSGSNALKQTIKAYGGSYLAVSGTTTIYGCRIARN